MRTSEVLNKTLFGLTSMRGWGVGSGSSSKGLSFAYLGFGIDEADSMLIDGN